MLTGSMDLETRDSAENSGLDLQWAFILLYRYRGLGSRSLFSPHRHIRCTYPLFYSHVLFPSILSDPISEL